MQNFEPTYISDNLAEFSEKISLGQYKAIVSDLDYTLTFFDNNAGIAALSQQFGDGLVKKVHGIFDLLINGGRYHLDTWDQATQYKDLLKQLAAIQNVEFDSVKKWCRASWIQYAAHELGIVISWEQLQQARDKYWAAIREGSILYEDANLFLQVLQERNIPLIIMTSSDAVFKITDKGLLYDPSYAKEYKYGRIVPRILYEDNDTHKKREVVIGDPIDKPSAAFTDIIEGVLRKKVGDYNPKEVLVMGDSPRTDLIPFGTRGFETLWVNRK